MKIESRKKYMCIMTFTSEFTDEEILTKGKPYISKSDGYIIDNFGYSVPIPNAEYYLKPYDEPKTPDGMMPFDIEKAKAGTKVIARYGEPVRILCYDLQNEKCIAAAVLWKEGECVYSYLPNGKYYTDNDNVESPLDLFHPETEIWTNLYTTEYDNRYSGGLFSSKIEALKNIIEKDSKYIGTYKLVKE